MQVSQISFGRKIPRYTCKIQDKRTDEFVPATIYEYNCKDEADFEEVKSLNSKKWPFASNIAKRMENKHAVQTYLHQKSNNSFYALQANGELLGLAQVNNFNGISNIDYITTKPHNEFKYVGQTLIAGIGKEFLKHNGFNLTVATAIDDAIPFYKRIGFKEFGEQLLRMNTREVEELIDVTEAVTESPILDKRG